MSGFELIKVQVKSYLAQHLYLNIRRERRKTPIIWFANTFVCQQAQSMHYSRMRGKADRSEGVSTGWFSAFIWNEGPRHGEPTREWILLYPGHLKKCF